MNQNPSLVFSGVYLVVCITLAIWKVSFRRLLVVAGIGFLLSFNLGAATAIQLQTLITFVALLPCYFIQEHMTVSRIVLLLLFCLGLSVGYASYTEYPVYVRLNKALAKYPMVSLADRLSYEIKTQQTTSPPDLSERQDEQLRLAERSQEYNLIAPDQRRVHYLEQLHAKTTFDFLGSPGFGLDRMTANLTSLRMKLKNRPELLDLPEEELIPVPNLALSLDLSDPTQTQDAAPEKVPLFMWSWVDELHRLSREDLFYADRIGYVKERQLVAGFQSHRFTKIPESAFALIRLELVSLLKHPEPRVYVSENLPEMGSLKQVPTRQLNAFETQSLERLRLDRDLELKMQGKRVLMIGSLRASNGCLKCHTVARGELLGALSYELVRFSAFKATGSP